jgi:hypothetical protein
VYNIHIVYNIYIHMYIHASIYIYIKREREREKKKNIHTVYTYTHTYIYKIKLYIYSVYLSEIPFCCTNLCRPSGLKQPGRSPWKNGTGAALDHAAGASHRLALEPSRNPALYATAVVLIFWKVNSPGLNGFVDGFVSEDLERLGDNTWEPPHIWR